MKSEKQTSILQALASIGPMTGYEIRTQTGITKDACEDGLRRLKGKGMIMVVDYKLDGSGARRKVPVYTDVGLSATKKQSYGVWAGLVR